MAVKILVKATCTVVVGGVFWAAERYGVLPWAIAYVTVNAAYRIRNVSDA